MAVDRKCYELAKFFPERLVNLSWFQNFERLETLRQIMLRGEYR